jgi:hypothetical protein
MRDHRRSKRRATSSFRLCCELILADKTLSSLLLDESQDGFGVLAAGVPSIVLPQKAYLHNYIGWFDCEIVYAAEVLPKTDGIYRAVGVEKLAKNVWKGDDLLAHLTTCDIDKFTNQTQGPWFRLGIHCLQQIMTPSAAPPPVETETHQSSPWIKSLLPFLFHR